MEPTGKTVAHHTYLHVSAMDELDSERHESVSLAAGLARASAGHDFNVVKLNHERSSVSLLDNPDFFEAAFPVLRLIGRSIPTPPWCGSAPMPIP